jgi:hypothetical protein
MTSERNSILSEIQTLEMMIEETPQSSVFELYSLKGRLEDIKEELKEYDASNQPQKALLAFDGAPVNGARSINASFAAKALDIFSEAVSMAFTPEDKLGYQGPIPKDAKNQLVITGTALGSFGFELELSNEEVLPGIDDDSHPTKALKKITDLFERAARGTDDEVAEMVESIHKRTVKKLHEFLELLSKQKATCKINFDDQTFILEKPEEIERACRILSDESLTENERSLVGKLTGILPETGSFELKTADEIIIGKLNFQIKDLRALYADIISKEAEITLKYVKVGSGKPRYSLESEDKIKLLPHTPKLPL